MEEDAVAPAKLVEKESTPVITKQIPSGDILHASEDDSYQETDVFAWANNLFEYKEELVIELFWINKNNVVYRTKLDPNLAKYLQPLFIDQALDYVLDGAERGMVVRSFEDGEGEEGVLQRVRWKQVEKLREVMHWIRTQEHEIELFTEEEHDLKRIKGALARVSHPKMPQPFYLIKSLPGGQILKGEGTWMVQGKVFKTFQAAALKIPVDAHMLILDQDLYVFNQAKLDRLFGYDAKKNSIAAKKVQAIEEHYKLSFAEGIDLQSAIQGNKALINKLQKMEIGELKQEQLIDHAEELGVDLMVDDNGAIIIMNQRDLAKFVNLLNDDYIESNLTGIRYEVQRKRPLKLASDDTLAI
ncbi:MAG TPA: Kiwa anti-phage protein KwaB-like domain-containing protein [Candidatus Saccharimonadales bacterium]|nr:Kiwa anti-phage protein KwaB-like domain-containing protein [Candidatus Saccharimonadales bacterium]